MATFVMHPVFGAGAAYGLSQDRRISTKFIVLSTFCQWIPDIDTLTYLVGIDGLHPFGHRGMAHSFVFAALVAFMVMHWGYRHLRAERQQWGMMYGWFFCMTALHGIFDGMTQTTQGVAYFWPFDSTRYVLPWQPLMDVPIAWSALQGPLWQAILVEMKFFGILLAVWFVVVRLVVGLRSSLAMRESAEVGTVAVE